MNATPVESAHRITAKLPGVLPALEAAYKDLHAHPELSMQERRTAGIAAKHRQENGYEVTSGVGEATRLDYASTSTAEDANSKPARRRM